MRSGGIRRGGGEEGYLHKLLKSFQQELLPSLSLASENEKDYSFSDIYAQTIAYSLFTARIFSYVQDQRQGNPKETLFDRESAWRQLPETNPFLRRLFQDVSERSGDELGDELIGAIAEIFAILRAAKMDVILQDFREKQNREDIVIRFYEDFLAAYKPDMRERRGVYYTPEPVVSYMVRSVDVLLKEKFNKPLGLADPEVMILDPFFGFMQQSLRNLQISDDVMSTQYALPDTRDWKINSRRRSLSSNKEWEKHLTKCLYRPFDVRAYYHHKDVVELPRNEVMKQMLLGENLGLITMRQIINNEYSHFGVTNTICSHGTFYLGNKGQDYLFPLYLYPDQNSLTPNRRSNFSQLFLNDITAKLSYTPTPEAIFYYIYAIFHSPTYRSRYAEFLKIDFPRVPLTRDDTLFRQLATYGEQLVALHLMKSDTLKPHQPPQFIQQGGKNIVDPAHPKYDINTRSVIINKKGDRFTDIPQPVWNFYVGGYPVCAKWLKDRKGRTLSPADIAHYQQIVIALGETIKLMAAIDQAIPGFPIE